MHNKYSSTKSMLTFIAAFSWAGVVLGTLILLQIVPLTAGVDGFVSGCTIIAASILLFAMTQIARAQIDTAEISAEILALLRGHKGTMNKSDTTTSLPKAEPGLWQ